VQDAFAACLQEWQAYSLPARQPSDFWSVLKTQEHLCSGVDDVRSRLGHWNPFSRLLVGQPGASRFAIPCDVSTLSAELISRTHRSLVVGAFGWTTLAAMAFVMYLRLADNYFLGFAGMAAIMASLSCSERWFGLRDRGGLSQRALFFYWLQNSPTPRIAFFSVLGIGVLVGLCQFLIQTRLGSFERLVEGYGFYYPAVRQGEQWRVLTEPVRSFVFEA
jgi:hypothetical protein